jgi:hypothetical protein
MTSELNGFHKKCLKQEIISELTEIPLEKLQELVKQNVQEELKQYQHSTNKNLEKTQIQLNELREDINKLQSEKTGTIKEEI